MATSGTFTGSRGGGSTGPYLTLHWQRVETDIANNRSKIRLTLRLHADYRISFSSSKTGVLHGQSFTYSGGFSGTGSKVLRTRDVWVNHNADGTKSQSFSASFNIAITYSGSRVNTLSVSGTASIDAIPRASDLTAFSLTNTTLNTNTANTVTYTLDRKSSSFSHQMTLSIGGKTIKSWMDSGTGSRTHSLSGDDVNKIIASLPNSTSGTLTLRMQTKSGSTNIGSAVTRTRGITLNSAIRPTASGLSVAIHGSGRDKSINKYVQGVTRVTASFSRSAGYGATISTSYITVKRSDGKDSQTISGTSGTTAKPVSMSGTYVVEAYVRDSRGRTHTTSQNITVHEYSAPKINKFTTARSSPSSNVNAAIDVTWSTVGGSNPATITVVGISNTDPTPKTLYTLNNSTDGSLNTTRTFTGQSDSQSFEYIITITDSFGKVTSSSSTVGTAFIELTINRSKGVGIGKVHERGSLDVAGEAHFSGQVYLSPPMDQDYNYPRFQLHSADNNGHSYMEWFNPDGVRKAYIGVPNSTAEYFEIRSAIDDNPSNFGYIWLGPQKLSMIDDVAYYNGKPVFTSRGLLWSGVYYMQETQTITPTTPITECPNGWILAWSRYSSGTAHDDSWSFSFIPRVWQETRSGGGGIHFALPTETGSFDKYLYITNTQITGHSRNRTAPHNTRVLRYVFAW